MTRPIPNDPSDDPDELRRRWLQKFLRILTKYDPKLRKILNEGAESVYKEINLLAGNSTFSAGVRSAQLRLVMKEINVVLRDVYGEIQPVIKDGQKESAKSAVEAFTETDREYLEKAFQETTRRSGIEVSRFIEGQKQQAAIHVAQAISNVQERGRYSLSEQVYQTRALSTGWVRRQVTREIMRGSSAKQIADTVRKSIKPTTPGGVSYAALRLGRTELNNAFHATSINLAKDRPWVEGMRWHLSQTHDFTLGCKCETYSGQIFEVNNVPEKPHPQCRCYVTPQLEPFDIFARQLTSGRYRDWIEHAA